MICPTDLGATLSELDFRPTFGAPARSSSDRVQTPGPCPLSLAKGNRPPRWERPTRERLLLLSRLPAGWDGSGARPVGEGILQEALRWLVEVMPDDAPAPQIVPLARGGVQLEWHLKGIDLEVEFRSPILVWAGFESAQEAWEHDVATEVAPVVEVLRQLSR